MAIPSKITLTKEDLEPPVYLAGSFTGWQPTIVMDSIVRSDQSRMWKEFSSTVNLDPGEHQYKFKLGDGDWWVVDDASPQGMTVVYNAYELC